MSILLYPSLPVDNQFQVSMWTALALSGYLRQNVGLSDVYIKWPNDIYVHDKKIAGILIEHMVKPGKIDHSIIGIGLNLNQEHFPSELPYATSILMETGKMTSVQKSMIEIRKRLLAFMQADPAKVYESYCEQLYLRHQPARFMVKATQTVLLGCIQDVDELGRLRILQIQENKEQPETCKQIFHHFELNEISFLR